MKKKGTDKRIEVKATVTEVIDSKTDTIYDGGIYRDVEREMWMEDQRMRRDIIGRGGNISRSVYGDLHNDLYDDVDEVLPKRDYYVETTTRVRVRYVVDRQVYEREAVLTGVNNWRLKGRKIYLTLDPTHPGEILEASRYKKLGNDLWFICGMLLLMVAVNIIICVSMLYPH